MGERGRIDDGSGDEGEYCVLRVEVDGRYKGEWECVAWVELRRSMQCGVHGCEEWWSRQ